MNSFLEELKAFRNFVAYNKADKLPIDVHTGKLAESDNPITWASYDEVFAYTQQHWTAGIGFMLSDDVPYSVIDLDDPYKEDNNNFTEEQKQAINAKQQEIAIRFNDTYQEISPSDKGLHIWVKGKVNGFKRNKFELYSRGRYFTITGNVFVGKSIAEAQAKIEFLQTEFAVSQKTLANLYESQPETQTDKQVIALCESGSNGNGEMFRRLFAGDIQGFPSESEADLAMINIIAFYTDNKEQCARLYYASDLFRKSKKRKRKNKNDYLFNPDWGLVNKAFDQKGPLCDFTELLAAFKTQVDVKEIEEPEEIETEESHNEIWDAPIPGLVGKIAYFIYQNAVFPVPEVAISAAIAYVAGIAGRAYNTTSGSGLNQYVILLAKTAGGKEAAASGIGRLHQNLIKEAAGAYKFFGPSGIASPQGLIKQLSETPAFMSLIGEFGLYLQTLTNKYAKGNELAIRRVLLELYTKSGAGQTLQGTVYSDRAKNIPTVESPSFTFLGESTPQEFYKAVDETNISEGLISRFTVIESSHKRPVPNQYPNSVEIDYWMASDLKNLALACLNAEIQKQPKIVLQSDAAALYQKQYQTECLDKVYSDHDNPVLGIWSRAHLRLLRLASLIAVGENHVHPCVDLHHMEWAKLVVEHGCNRLIDKFQSGKVGTINESVEQHDTIMAVIRKFKASAYKEGWQKNYGVNRQMHSAHCITHRYLQLLCMPHKCFGNSSNSAMAFKNAINDLIDNGILEKIDLRKLKDSGKFGIAYYILS